MQEKPGLSFLQIVNMSVGFFGIQFGWGLQMGNMSAIYEYLGVSEGSLPLLWLAAPVTGLIVQPIIGHFSDRTWGPLGRRRPYFLVGAIFASVALFFMPRSGIWWMAAGLLWVLDASINVSMEPFRAFVADLLPERQRAFGFAMQSVFIGAGAVIASLLPTLLQAAGVSIVTNELQPIPQTVHIAFTTGAIVFLAAILWTVLTTQEYPPEESEGSAQPSGHGLWDIWDAILTMPARMKQLAWVQFFTWMGLFCMWIFYSVAVPRDMMGVTDTESVQYKDGVNLAQQCFAAYNFVAFLAALALLHLVKRHQPKWIHVVALLLGGLGLMSVGLVRDPWLLRWVSFTGVGIAWASILSMPYALLAGCLPARRVGVYMGIFNLFIVIPQILVAIILSGVLEMYPEISRLQVVVFGGACLTIAAVATMFVNDRPETASAA